MARLADSSTVISGSVAQLLEFVRLYALPQGASQGATLAEEAEESDEGLYADNLTKSLHLFNGDVGIIFQIEDIPYRGT